MAHDECRLKLSPLGAFHGATDMYYRFCSNACAGQMPRFSRDELVLSPVPTPLFFTW